MVVSITGGMTNCASLPGTGRVPRIKDMQG